MWCRAEMLRELAEAQEHLASLLEEQQQGAEAAQNAANTALDSALGAVRQEVAELQAGLGETQAQQQADRQLAEDGNTTLAETLAAAECAFFVCTGSMPPAHRGVNTAALS